MMYKKGRLVFPFFLCYTKMVDERDIKTLILTSNRFKE